MNATSGPPRTPRRIRERARETVSLSIAITIFGLLSAGIVGAYEKFFIPSREATLNERIARIESSAVTEKRAQSEQITALELRLKDLEKARTELLDQLSRPAPLSPRDGAVVLTTEVQFTWDYGAHRPGDHNQYVIEIAHLEGTQLRARRFNVVQPDRRLFIYPIDQGKVGRYYWRVRPGRLVQGELFASGPWSSIHSFSVYRSPIEKIRETKELIVGMYPQFNDKFNRLEEGGVYSGFSIEVANYLAAALAKKLVPPGQAIRVRVEESSWQDLLPRLSRGDFDVVISSVTATQARERQHDIRFSAGYYSASQLLLATSKRYDDKRSLFQNLRNATLGAVAGTTNERAAKYLAAKCDCSLKVRAEYRQFAEVATDLVNGKLDVVLADDVFATGEVAQGNFKQFGGKLEGELKEYFQREYGRPSDEYAVALRSSYATELLTIINAALESAEGKQLLVELRKKYGV